MTKTAITGARIFDGAVWHDRSALVINDGVVEGLVAADSPTDAIRVPADGALLVPGFVDLQVNGGGGALLNLTPTLDAIRTICTNYAQFGTTALLPTLITDTPEKNVVAIAAGAEAVAATKTFVASIVAGLGILGNWLDDKALLAALESLPELLEQAVHVDWSPLLGALDEHNSLYVLGRGPALAIASEAALKFKETCGMHAEAYSAAEVLHGPARIVERHFPVLALAARDAAEASVAEVAERLAGQGARTFITSVNAQKAERLPFAASGHTLTDALALIVTFYAFVESLSRRRGFNPDQPPHLKKVTETI